MPDQHLRTREVTLVETNQRVQEVGRRFLRRRAESLARRHPPAGYDCEGAWLTTYHLRIERVGRFKYAVVAYQNVLVPDEDLLPCECDREFEYCPRHDV